MQNMQAKESTKLVNIYILGRGDTRVRETDNSDIAESLVV